MACAPTPELIIPRADGPAGGALAAGARAASAAAAGICFKCYRNSGRTIDSAVYDLEGVYSGPLSQSLLDTRPHLARLEDVERVLRSNYTQQMAYTSVRRSFAREVDLAPYAAPSDAVAAEPHLSGSRNCMRGVNTAGLRERIRPASGRAQTPI